MFHTSITIVMLLTEFRRILCTYALALRNWSILMGA